MSKELKAVFIDWNGTLSTSNFWEHLEHQDPATYNKIQSTLFTGGLAYLIEPWMVGEHYTEDIIRNLARNTGIEEHKLYYEFVYACKTMQLVSPDILSLVSQLRSRGIKVVIATDNMDSFNRWTVPTLGLTKRFDAILNSYDLRVRKKDFDGAGNSLFFGKYLEEHGLLPQETILIDDSADRDSRISHYGINYRKIEFGQGLLEELQKILSNI